MREEGGEVYVGATSQAHERLEDLERLNRFVAQRVFDALQALKDSNTQAAVAALKDADWLIHKVN